MAKYNLTQIGNIIVNRPNKKRIVHGQKLNRKLMLHLHGTGMKQAMKKLDYFENQNIYVSRKEYAVSNVDLFDRLLKEESQVYTTRGGSQTFGLPPAQEKDINKKLSNVVYGQSLRKWVQNFGYNALKADPMGIILMEHNKATDIEGSEDAEAGTAIQADAYTPECYPVYRSIQEVWDYKSNGQQLDYVCFALDSDELEMYGIQAKTTNLLDQTNTTYNKDNKQYFRFIDDIQDVIVKMENKTAIAMNLVDFGNPLPNPWGRVPGFIVSDLIRFSDPGTMDTPIGCIVELADCFLMDRSMRDLQKKYHGFAKAFEPFLACSTCGGKNGGNGLVKGQPCPDCTIPGQSQGTGYKLTTTIGDVARFPLEILVQAPHFDVKKIFGYVTPDIKSWEQQNSDLQMLEALMYSTYWGCDDEQIQGYNGSQAQEETATKTLTNMQSKYSVLNKLADWSEKTERMIADLIGQFYYGDSWVGANIAYGRDYILESPEEILVVYHDMKANGDMLSALNEQMIKYIKCLYQSNPNKMNIELKKLMVNPFPHSTPLEVEMSPIVVEIDKIANRYYGEWSDTITDPEWGSLTPEVLMKSLNKYALSKQAILEAEKPEEKEIP